MEGESLTLRQQLKTRDVFFREEIIYLQNQLDDRLRCPCCSSKKENNSSTHQKRKSNYVENSRASEVLKNKKTVHPKKIT